MSVTGESESAEQHTAKNQSANERLAELRLVDEIGFTLDLPFANRFLR